MAKKTKKVDLENAALIIVDVQNDFCPGGALPVPDGDKVVKLNNRMVNRALRNNWPIFASRDWHPLKTKHFNTNGGIWPPHCVRYTKGAEFHKDLRLPYTVMVISKGMSREEDEKSYSAFGGSVVASNFDPTRGWIDMSDAPYLEMQLTYLHIDTLFIGGLATDYCVKATVLDALKEKFIKKVYLLEDACRAANLKPNDGANAIAEMKAAGALITSVKEDRKSVV